MDKKMRHSVLIIDDESVNLKKLNQILWQEYTILTATNGIDGIEKAKEYMPDIILLDIVMPDMDGYQTFSSLKKNIKTKSIPVIFLSGPDCDEYEEKGLTLEAADYITKPFKAPIVKLRISNHIRLKTAVKTAEAASRSKSVFMAKMSHEIRSPLNGILALSSEYINNRNYPQEITDVFFRVYHSGALMLGIVNDILDMSRIEAGKLELTMAEYNIAGLLNDIMLLNIIKYEKKPIKFFLSVDEDVPSKFLGDEIRVKQILNNLLSNAFKYTASGEVELSVSADNSKSNDDLAVLVFRVRDTGQGMPEEQLTELFDEHTGLGMRILMELIKMMNGNIAAKSEPGCGTQFTVRLPQKNANKHSVLGKEAVEKLMNIRSNFEKYSDRSGVESEPIPFGKVLVVDDVDINQFVVKEMLSYYGLEVDLASSGEEALEKVKTNDYNLVFMDYLMPGMDGLEATKEIRKLGCDINLSNSEKYGKLPVVALTADVVAGVKDLLLSNGCSDFISKPVDLRELTEILKKWL